MPNASAAVEPVVEIYVKETQGELQDHVGRFKTQCLQKPKNAMPYVNEDFTSTEFNGLIYEYDAQTLRDILPEVRDTRPEGRYRQRLLEFFQDIAKHESIRSNLILVNSESTYCQANQAFYDDLRPVIESIPENGLKTIVILIVCGGAERAAIFNNDRAELFDPTKNKRHTFFGFSADANISHLPYFLGFEGTVHTIKEHIFVCSGKFLEDDFPTRICATDLPVNGNKPENKASKKANRERCCDAMIKEFPLHFIKSFKTDRHCIKVTKEKFIERIQHIIRTGGTKKEDAAIRMFKGSRHPYDGTYCISTAANPDPCGIDSESNIVNSNTKTNVATYSELIHSDNKILGQLIFEVTKSGENFQRIWTSLPDNNKRREFARYRTPDTASDDIKNSTLLGLVLKNTTAKPGQKSDEDGGVQISFPVKPAKMRDDIKFQIVKSLVDSGADLTVNGDSVNSILDLTLKGFKKFEIWSGNVEAESEGQGVFGNIEYLPPPANVQDYILFKTDTPITLDVDLNETIAPLINPRIIKSTGVQMKGDVPATREHILNLLKRISTGNGIRLVDREITVQDFFQTKRLTTTPRTLEENQAVLNKLREMTTVNGVTKPFIDFIKDANGAIGSNTAARRQALFNNDGRIVGAAAVPAGEGGARRRNRRVTRKRKSKVTRRNRKSKTRKH